MTLFSTRWECERLDKVSVCKSSDMNVNRGINKRICVSEGVFWEEEQSSGKDRTGALFVLLL